MVVVWHGGQIKNYIGMESLMECVLIHLDDLLDIVPTSAKPEPAC